MTDDNNGTVYFVLGYNGNKIFFKIVSNTETKYIALNKKLTRHDVAYELKVPYAKASQEIPKIIDEAARKKLSKEEVYRILAYCQGDLKDARSKLQSNKE